MVKEGDKLITKPFLYWCQKVLPLVYDDSLSYYEVLCKVVKYLNDLIAQDNVFADEIESVKAEVKQLSDIVNNWNKASDEFFNQWMQNHLANMIFVEINEAGYFVYYVPQMWDSITFNTTGLDIELKIQPQYGHLVLSY